MPKVPPTLSMQSIGLDIDHVASQGYLLDYRPSTLSTPSSSMDSIDLSSFPFARLGCQAGLHGSCFCLRLLAAPAEDVCWRGGHGSTRHATCVWSQAPSMTQETCTLSASRKAEQIRMQSPSWLAVTMEGCTRRGLLTGTARHFTNRTRPKVGDSCQADSLSGRHNFVSSPPPCHFVSQHRI
jgi:hypothetical protein